MTVLLLGLTDQDDVDHQASGVLELGLFDCFFHGPSDLKAVLRQVVTHPLESDIKRHDQASS